jgi:hypothetical protein
MSEHSTHPWSLPFEPTSDQVAAIEAIIEWWTEGDPQRDQVFRLFGYAGTGKTSIAIYLPQILGLHQAGRYRFGAFSGKAVNVLQTKMVRAGKAWQAEVEGLAAAEAAGQVEDLHELVSCVPAEPDKCATLHKLLYGPPIDLKKENARLEELISGLHAAMRQAEAMGRGEAAELSFWSVVVETFRDRGGRNMDLGFGASDWTPQDARDQIKALDEQIRINTQVARARGWLYFAPQEASPLLDVDLLIADEVSMVSDHMAQDILSTGVRVLVLGDPEQLPPISGNGYFVRPSAGQPDAMLQTVTRQAAGSPVLSIATQVRAGVDTATWAEADSVILCWRRATRWGAVKYVRETLLGRPAGVPVPGDKIMVLANNSDIGVFNGQTFVVDEVEMPLGSGPAVHPAHSEPAPWGTGRPIGAEVDPFDTPLQGLVDVFDSGDPDVIRLQVHEEGVPDSSTPLEVYRFGFLGDKEEKDAGAQRLGSRGKIALATFAQAVTVHKAQGSEWGKVLFIDEGRAMFSMEANRGGYDYAERQTRRFRYTAITRARDEIVVVRKS